jgi:hypothetical protein
MAQGPGFCCQAQAPLMAACRAQPRVVVCGWFPDVLPPGNCPQAGAEETAGLCRARHSSGWLDSRGSAQAAGRGGILPGSLPGPRHLTLLVAHAPGLEVRHVGEEDASFGRVQKMAGEVREGLGRQGAVDPKGESVWGLPIQSESVRRFRARHTGIGHPVKHGQTRSIGLTLALIHVQAHAPDVAGAHALQQRACGWCARASAIIHRARERVRTGGARRCDSRTHWRRRPLAGWHVCVAPLHLSHGDSHACSRPGPSVGCRF